MILIRGCKLSDRLTTNFSVDPFFQIETTMPTRIVLNETVAAVSPSSSPIGRLRPTYNAADVESGRSVISTPNNRNPIGSPTSRNTAGFNSSKPNSPNVPRSSRKVVTLRSSLFPAIKEDSVYRRLSREDIRASPRLLGYIFQLLASTVMLISVLKFRFEDERTFETTPAVWSWFKKEGANVRDDLFITLAGPVFTWKLIGCFVVGSLGTIINLLIILTHFDTIFFPSLWLRVFRDGSRYEQFIVIAMVVFWAGGIHINTSSLSVGESQANVFFTTWISFFSAFINGGVWRVSAGRRSIAEFVNEHHRATTYNWLWTFIFASTCAGAMAGTYLNREYVSIFFEGQSIELSRGQWILALTVVWGLAVSCILAIVLNHVLKKSCEVRVCNNRLVLIGWRQAEGLLAIGLGGEWMQRRSYTALWRM
jgi:hypothetical protein